MMDNKLHITPYTKEHGQFILSCQMNHKILEADSEYIKVSSGSINAVSQDEFAISVLSADSTKRKESDWIYLQSNLSF